MLLGSRQASGSRGPFSPSSAETGRGRELTATGDRAAPGLIWSVGVRFHSCAQTQGRPLTSVSQVKKMEVEGRK